MIENPRGMTFICRKGPCISSRLANSFIFIVCVKKNLLDSDFPREGLLHHALDDEN